MTNIPLVPLISYTHTHYPNFEGRRHEQCIGQNRYSGITALWAGMRTTLRGGLVCSATVRVKITKAPDFCGGAIVSSCRVDTRTYNPETTSSWEREKAVFLVDHKVQNHGEPITFQEQLALPAQDRMGVDVDALRGGSAPLTEKQFVAYCYRCMAASVMSYLAGRENVYSFVCSDQVDGRNVPMLDAGAEDVQCYSPYDLHYGGRLGSDTRTQLNIERAPRRWEGRFDVRESPSWWNRKTGKAVRWHTVGLLSEAFDWEGEAKYNEDYCFDEDEDDGTNSSLEVINIEGNTGTAWHPEIVRGIQHPLYLDLAPRFAWSNA